MGGGIVHIARDPHDVVDLLVADEAEQIRDLEFAPKRPPSVPLGDGLEERRKVAHDQANRQAARHDLPARRAGHQRPLEPRQLGGAQVRRGLRHDGLPVLAVGATVAAQVEQEHLDRAIAHRPIEPLRIRAVDRQRGVLDTGLACMRGLQRHRLDRESPVVVLAPLGVPVVAHLVIVPHGELRHGGVEAPHVRVLQVVAVVAAILVDRLSHLALGQARQVAPARAVVERHLRHDGRVGVDRIAEVHEQVGLDPEHAGIRLHAAVRRVEPPALSHRVGRKDHRHVARARRRRREELPRRRCAPPAQVGQVLEQHSIEDPLPSRQIGEVHPGREVRAFERRGPHDPPRPSERVARGVLHRHPGGAVGPRPDHGRVLADKRRGHAVGHEWTRRRAHGHRRRLPEDPPGCRHRGAQRQRVHRLAASKQMGLGTRDWGLGLPRHTTSHH